MSAAEPVRQLSAAEFERALRGCDRPYNSKEMVEFAVRGAVEEARRRLCEIDECPICSGDGAVCIDCSVEIYGDLFDGDHRVICVQCQLESTRRERDEALAQLDTVRREKDQAVAERDILRREKRAQDAVVLTRVAHEVARLRAIQQRGDEIRAKGKNDE